MNFPSALYRVIQDPANSDWIQWVNNGKSFRFHDWNRLINALRGFGFKASRRSSVDRNFHDYRFKSKHNGRRRVQDLKDNLAWFQFQHEFFTRESPTITKITRLYGSNTNQ
ncbi:hypothetical protein BX070DRAFT_251654 [Coemansia spiralis]|nr:hypothetical protein BX070DRAFT_251654 [Coemansia spiralis]